MIGDEAAPRPRHILPAPNNREQNRGRQEREKPPGAQEMEIGEVREDAHAGTRLDFAATATRDFLPITSSNACCDSVRMNPNAKGQ